MTGIEVYTLPDCVSCDLTKRAFDRRGLEYTEIPLTDEHLARFREQGARSAPIVVTPDMWWYGLKPDLIHQAWKDARERDRMGRPQGNNGA